MEYKYINRDLREERVLLQLAALEHDHMREVAREKVGLELAKDPVLALEGERQAASAKAEKARLEQVRKDLEEHLKKVRKPIPPATPPGLN